MSTPPGSPDRDDVEQLEIQSGRRAPFSMNPDWVLLSGVSRDALAVYWALAAHVNQQRGDAEVWPTQTQLARIVGYGKRQSVKARIDELVSINAVEIRRVATHDGMRHRSIYTVHQTPPSNWGGHQSMRDFYRALNAEFSHVVPNVPHGGHSNAPHEGRSNVPHDGPSNAPYEGPEPDQQEPDQQEPEGTDSLRSSVPRAGADEGDAPGRTDGGDEPKNKSKGKDRARVRGMDLHTVRLDGKTIAVTDEHRELAEQVAAELLGADGAGSDGEDTDLWQV